ncbi:MAG TPA: hypothetical protein VG167_00965 [Verrucomicrobiae bacterium]|nr:hypothetical protein [Verrucomicrobiae bacterium]
MKEKPSKLDAYAERLDEWFGEKKMTLEAVREQLRLDGCTVSISRLGEWWSQRQSRRLQDRLLEQIASGARQCQDVEKALGKSGAPELNTLIKLHRVLILKLSTEGNADPEKLELVNRMMREVQKFARLEQLAEQNKLEARRLDLLERKAALADQAKEVTESALTPEEKQLKLKQIFGMG